MLRRAYEANDPDHPERILYVAAMRWPDGSQKQASIVFDELAFAQMQAAQGDRAPSRERVLLDTMATMVESLLTRRRDELQSRTFAPRK
jgi:hypothetical protein